MLLRVLSVKISVHTADVKQALRVYSLEVAARDKEDLKEEPIVVKLRKVCILSDFEIIYPDFRRRLEVQAMTVFEALGPLSCIIPSFCQHSL